MRPIEYTERKNILFLKHIGMELVPKEQLEDSPATLKMLSRIERYNLSLLAGDKVLTQEGCLHCAVHMIGFNKSFWCMDCPIYLQGNYCGYRNSSYQRCLDAISAEEFDDTDIRAELIALAKEFVEGNIGLRPAKEKENK